MCFAFIGRYLLYRIGLGLRPHVDPYVPWATDAIGPLLNVPRRYFLQGQENVPYGRPMIVCGNHSKLDDPLMIYHAGRLATGGKLLLRVMTRIDYFTGFIFENRLVAIVDFFACCGAYSIDRDNVSLSQLKPFLKLLENGEGFIIFPGRTRTRSGVFIEYRDQFTEPGGISFFVHQTQRKRPEVPVAALPVVRTHNPVTKRTSMIIGPPLYLDAAASREALRTFDYDLVIGMSGLVELNLAQAASAALYLWCLHRGNAPLRIADLSHAVRTALAETAHPYVNPEDLADPDRALDQVLRWLARCRCISIDGGTIRPNPRIILGTPPLDTTYKKLNPVKYLANQILHLGEVTAIVEREVLAIG